MQTLETLIIKIAYECQACGNNKRDTILVFEYPRHVELLCTSCETRYKGKFNIIKKKINAKISKHSNTKPDRY